uniref:Polyprenal reductase n=1 Tax=Timema douglasi TaxID=61478 RepID=A0A7R8VD22_TIMDO|nr:unnamed protein product [Timema douglasi]
MPSGAPISCPASVPSYRLWFRHFYVFAAAYTSIITLVTFQLYFVSGTFTLSPAFSFALDLLASDDRTVKVSAVSCFLSLCLLTIHSWHRLYETWFISVFSDSRINILHYAVGYAHYIGAVAAILAESPGFTDTKVEYENDKLVSLLENVLDCDSVNVEDIRDWITNDEVDEITDNDIVEMVTQEEVIKEEENGRKNLILHSEGLKTIEAALQYINQQEEATPADIICLHLNAVFSLKDITLRDIYGCGLFLWACYHQYRSTVILANLRKNKKGKIVTHHHGIPYGGWFELVSSPHLLAEVIMYLALTIILWGAHTWPFIFLWVLSNQVESALLTHWWYLSKFEDYPKQRKSIIPYVL